MDAQVVSFRLSVKSAFFVLICNLDATAESPYATTKQHARQRTQKEYSRRMDNKRDSSALSVSRAESGQKLLNFLQRRINAPVSDFHRWIRTGQVRVNGARARAFDRLNEDDLVRVPPFAERLSAGSGTPAPSSASAGKKRSRLTVVFEDEDVLVLDKPAGLPVQGGTGHRESVASILAEERAHADFVPAPVHRLDRDTSGLLVAGKTYAAVRLLTDALAGRNDERPGKEYLAWVEGTWELPSPSELRDFLAKDRQEQRVRSRAPEKDSEAKEARCIVTCLAERTIHGHSYTLLLIRLLTGRTHQIRVQLAERGHPIAGDPWYGRPGRQDGGLKLHAFRLSIPVPGGKRRTFRLLPPWKDPWKAELPASLPDPEV